jgi:hypothetical protein
MSLCAHGLGLAWIPVTSTGKREVEVRAPGDKGATFAKMAGFVSSLNPALERG